MKNFWQKLKKPIICLAPMADVTDCAFRKIITKYGKPDVFWTEFVSADGLCHEKAMPNLLIDLKYSPEEKPIIAQIFGGNKDNIKKSAMLCEELGFDGLDINMGCPDRSVEKQKGGAYLIKDLELAKEIIRSAKAGVKNIPISVKTRIGYNKNEIDVWLRGLLEEDISALTVHLRTRKEMSKVPAHWDLMKEIVSLRDSLNKETIIIGNGDLMSIEEGKQKCLETGCDGVMLGRAIFGNPWLFQDLNSNFKKTKVISVSEKLNVLLEHTNLFSEFLGEYKNFAIMKKHFKAYVNGWDGAKNLRTKLMDTSSAKEVEEVILNYLKNEI